MAYLAGEPQASVNRVAVTGYGMITSLGLGKAANAEGFRAGRTSFRPVTLFDVSSQRATTAGEVRLSDKTPCGDPDHVGKRDPDRATRLLFHAAFEAWNHAEWDRDPPSDRLPLSLGSSAGAMELGERFYRRARNQASRLGQLRLVNSYPCQTQGVKLMRALDIEGPIRMISNACASGANAIGYAFQLIRRGSVDCVLCGGYDALSRLVFAGFDSLQALTPSGLPRPFAADRDGLALGEGAAVLCLENLGLARRRGARVIAEIAGYGSTTDTHHLTQPHPEGEAAFRSMTAACLEAGVKPEQIGYINAHGTGTPRNDAAEAKAICRWAGSAANGLSVSSTKGSIGHLLGGAGAVEAAICLMALEHGWIPPNVPFENKDPACNFDLVCEPRDTKFEYAMTNSFGFGGANATLLFRRSDT